MPVKRTAAANSSTGAITSRFAKAMRARITSGDHRKRECAEYDNDRSILPGQCRERQQDNRNDDKHKPRAHIAPARARAGKACKSRHRRIGEQHVLPDDALIDQELRRQHAQRRHNAAAQDGLGLSHKSDTIAAHNRPASNTTNRPAPGTAASRRPASTP